MNYFNPIYTEKNDCQDCYKCVRACPVKSIKVEDGSATVLYENCIVCGLCVEVCPAGAKKVRNDVDKVKQLLRLKEKVIVSLAPSVYSDFPGVHVSQLIAGIKKLGFYGVSETALGAQEVSVNVAEKMNNSKGNLFISSACPTSNEYIKKYYPKLADKVMDFYSPLLSHCKILKQTYGEEIGIVFAGPCISKKNESDYNPGLLDASLTFEDLRHWMMTEGILPELIKINEEENFIPHPAQEGTLYPIEGGMIDGIKYNIKNNNDKFMSFSGLTNMARALAGLENLKLKNNLFIEFLACEGGCINGPKAEQRSSTIIKRSYITGKVDQFDEIPPRVPEYDIRFNLNIEPVQQAVFTNDEIENTLHIIGKYHLKDELNCGGCGYNTCREFAVSVLETKSEKTMCVSYMRQLAQKKANALIKTMPSGIVIIDDNLKIIESNLIWAKMMGEETEMLFDVKPGMEGADIKKIFPFYKLFQNVLDTGIDLVGKEIEFNNTVMLFSLFTIEKHRVVGGIFRDITEPWVSKEQIITKAREVIRKNLSTVQKIAYLLGENASETEIILSGIVESFSKDKIDESNL